MPFFSLPFAMATHPFPRHFPLLRLAHAPENHAIFNIFPIFTPPLRQKKMMLFPERKQHHLLQIFKQP